MTCSGEPSILDQLHHLYSQMNSAIGHCTGVSPSRLRLLQQLYHHEEISQTALQKELQIDSAAITRQLKQLEAEGIITRRVNPSDNRITLVRLSELGRQRIISHLEEKVRFLDHMLQGFSQEEQQVLAGMIARLQANIQQYNPQK
ncbi:MAG: marR family protein [Paenibacillaceae bacterium]|nr:marR family protein [Paenibacillaceae bacterium]